MGVSDRYRLPDFPPRLGGEHCIESPHSRSRHFDTTAHQDMIDGVMQLSRRRFARLAGTAAVAGPPLMAQGSPLTAQQVVDRIQKNVGGQWQPQSLDTFKAGDPATPVTGIAP